MQEKEKILDRLRRAKKMGISAMRIAREADIGMQRLYNITGARSEPSENELQKLDAAITELSIIDRIPLLRNPGKHGEEIKKFERI